ncbi:MAG TPA: leucyl aminopeptidase [Candidatus Nanoarchaeia archaeon]|nr:leucyl aminopeptidase [Candidatus Nanoarchaeia archaeon]
MAKNTVSVKVTKDGLNKIKDNAIVIGFFKDKINLSGELKKFDNENENILSSYIKDMQFKGDKGETKNIYVNKKVKTVVLVGLGEEDKFNFEILSNAVAETSKKLRDSSIETFSILLSSFRNSKMKEEDAVEKISISLFLGLYKFADYKTKDKENKKYVKEIKILTDSNKSFENQLKFASAVGDAVAKTRDLVNTPPNIANTAYVAGYVKELAKNSNLKCTVFDEKQIDGMKMGCLSAVGRGSVNRPKLAVLEYAGAGREKPIALVGKGVTFDTGGYNLKPYPYILNMKDDLGGAAASIHIIEVCAKLKLPINLIVVTPLCENMIDADAFRPDDVLTAFNGVTVEIKNTDAEGRLILADALSYAASLKPVAIVDIASLTGASMVVLGPIGTPIISTDEKLTEKLKEASKKSLERIWELPLWPEYDDSIKSDVADIKNISEEGDAGVIIGAAFLKNFVDEIPWLHIDIGTTVWSKVDKGILTKGGTGASVRLMVEFLREWK